MTWLNHSVVWWGLLSAAICLLLVVMFGLGYVIGADRSLAQRERDRRRRA